MINGFYDTSIIEDKEAFLRDVFNYSYYICLQHKHNISRELDNKLSINDFFEKWGKEGKLDVIDRNIYNRNQIPNSDGEIVIHKDWQFLYCHLSLYNLEKVVNKYNLKLINW